MEAAFFDLDKTVISRPSMMIFAGEFRRHGLLRRSQLARAAWTQLSYLRWGAGPEKLARIQQSVLAVTVGWDQTVVRRIVAARLADAVDPVTFADATRLIDEHHRAGRRVYLLSAGPEEIVEQVGAHLGVDRSIGSRALLDGRGCYTGELSRYVYGPMKATIMREVAAADGIDLSASWGYSDSVTDLPMLEAVGHPVAVNPDRALRRVARMHGWEIAAFRHRGARAVVADLPATAPAGLVGTEPAGTQLPGTGAASPDGWGRNGSGRTPRRWPVMASAAALMTTTGGLTAWWWRRRVLDGAA